MKKGVVQYLVLSVAAMVMIVASGCSSKQSLNLNVHTEPEGAHVVYRLDDLQWIYLGVTPLNLVEVIHEDNLGKNNTFTLKAMRCGYLEQAREWTGDALIEEHDDKNMIFWTPRLVKDTQ